MKVTIDIRCETCNANLHFESPNLPVWKDIDLDEISQWVDKANRDQVSIFNAIDPPRGVEYNLLTGEWYITNTDHRHIPCPVCNSKIYLMDLKSEATYR